MSKAFTRYFDVDGVIVRVQGNGSEVTGEVVSTGAEFPPLKALNEGRELSKDQAAGRRPSNKPTMKQKIAQTSDLDILSRTYIWTGFVLIFVVGSWDDPTSRGYRITKDVLIFCFVAFVTNILIVMAVRSLSRLSQDEKE